MIKCTNCGFDQIPDGALRCTQCSYPVDQPIPPTPGMPISAPVEEIPWKRRDSLGFVQAFIENVKALATGPTEFFAKIRKDDDWISPLIWIAIISWISGFFSFLWSTVIHTPMLPFMKQYQGTSGGLSSFALGGVALFFLYFVLAPLWGIVGAFIWSGLVHLAAMVFGDGEEGYEVTFKVAAYSMTANLLGIIPICGSVIGGILGLFFLILGMKQGHRTETWKAVMSVLVWVILLFICCGLIALLGGLAAASLFHSASAS
jgi:hypothetical protein